MRWTFALVLFALGCGHSPATAPSDPNMVSGDEIRSRDIRRIEEMLRGQVAGVSVTPTANGGFAVRIRQAGGLVTTGDPLFVVDGLPIPLGTDGALDGLNPRDVASIRVLKNASDTAMYGSQGANGVVLITTIRPGPSPAPAPASQPPAGTRTGGSR